MDIALQHYTAPWAVKSGCEITVLRLDTLHPWLSGNKPFKLLPNIHHALAQGYQRVLGFGGAWSNNLHALAWLGRETGLQTIGVIRGERPPVLSPTLQDMAACGMQLHFVSREEYRQRDNPEWIAQLLQELGDAYVVPEGGANRLGVAGCVALGNVIEERLAGAYDWVVLPVATGGTLAGMSAGLPSAKKVMGVVVLKGAEALAGQVHALQSPLAPAPGHGAHWQLEHRFHAGGYAKSSMALREFCQEVTAQGLPLEPVYSGKAFHGLSSLCAEGFFHEGSRIVFLHTGGLQGARDMRVTVVESG